MMSPTINAFFDHLNAIKVEVFPLAPPIIAERTNGGESNMTAAEHRISAERAKAITE